MSMICENGVRECIGCMSCNPYTEPMFCELCGEEAEMFYYKNGELLGCDECITAKEAWEVAESA